MRAWRYKHGVENKFRKSAACRRFDVKFKILVVYIFYATKFTVKPTQKRLSQRNIQNSKFSRVRPQCLSNRHIVLYT